MKILTVPFHNTGTIKDQYNSGFMKKQTNQNVHTYKVKGCWHPGLDGGWGVNNPMQPFSVNDDDGDNGADDQVTLVVQDAGTPGFCAGDTTPGRCGGK